MYNKNFLGRAGLTPEFEDVIKTFIEWATGQRGHMDRDKIKCPYRKYKNTRFGTPDEESVQDYFEAPTILLVSEERTPAGHVAGNYPQWDDEQHMDWAQKMIFYAAEPSYFASSHEGVPDDGTRSCPVDAGPSSYCYGGSLYDYNESGLTDRFYKLVDAANHPLWDGCTQSRLGVVVELVDIKADGDYYNTKKLWIKNLGLPVEKIHACKKGYMLYWKDDVDLEYCKFCKDARHKLSQGRDPHWKKSPYAILRKRRGRCVIHPMLRRESILTGYILILQKSRVMLAWAFAQMVLHCTINTVVLIHVGWLSLHHTIFPLLWHVGVRTYDHAMDRAFIMRAALMWTVNDLPTYGMASRNKKTFMKIRIENKVARPRLTRDQLLDRVANISPAVEIPLPLPDGYGSDHKWTKKTIFWFLPYWSTLLIRHNFDVIHIEKSVFDNISNMVMDIKGKTNDNMNARRDLKIICN
ncbi:UNVERIFIED_CONTAM: hypothetical protein Scaly_2944500 [Sesamum calycinum]|uniref:Uncharacterized protein n=1 Tax=Sesamum calycinum TaxID=2727403 RepID=A0AAW2KXH4_9LAMI